MTHSPDELRREAEDFWAKKEAQTPAIRKEFEQAIVDSNKVIEVGDIVWWPERNATQLLAAVRLENGKCIALGYDDGKFSLPEASKFSWALNNLTTLPQIKLGEDCIEVRFTNERYLMAEFRYDKYPEPGKWRYTGIGCSGGTALKEFAKHGMTFSADFTPKE